MIGKISDIQWIFAKIKSKLKHSKEPLSVYLRKQGMTIGNNTITSSQLKTSEPYLITIGDNVTISHDVDLITHDNSVCKLFGIDHDLYGKITIGDNCFIGAHSIILYGVSIADNVIVGTGSVVTKSIRESNVVVAGNPARVICTWKEFELKTSEKVVHAGHLPFKEKKEAIQNSGRIIEK